MNYQRPYTFVYDHDHGLATVTKWVGWIRGEFFLLGKKEFQQFHLAKEWAEQIIRDDVAAKPRVETHYYGSDGTPLKAAASDKSAA